MAKKIVSNTFMLMTRSLALIVYRTPNLFTWRLVAMVDTLGLEAPRALLRDWRIVDWEASPCRLPVRRRPRQQTEDTEASATQRVHPCRHLKTRSTAS